VERRSVVLVSAEVHGVCRAPFTYSTQKCAVAESTPNRTSPEVGAVFREMKSKSTTIPRVGGEIVE